MSRWAAAALGLGALALGALSANPAGPALALGVATLVAFATPLALPLGVLAALVALAQTLPVPLDPLSALGLGVGGVALGAFARAVGDALPGLLRRSPLGLGAGLCLIAVVVAALPDDRVVLQAADGGPLHLAVAVQHAALGVRVLTDVLGVVRVAPALDGLLGLLPWLAAGASFLLLAALAWGREEARPVAWWSALGVAALLTLVAVAGLWQLLAGAVALPSQQVLAAELARSADGGLAVAGLTVPPEASLGLGSRPASDALRLVVGLGLALLAWTRLRPAKHPARPLAAAEGVASVALPVAVAASLVAAALSLDGPSAYALAGAAVAGAAALISGQFTHVARRAPDVLVALALAVSVYAWVAPLAGWLPG